MCLHMKHMTQDESTPLLDLINHLQNRSKRRKYKGSFEVTTMDMTEEGATLVLRASPYFRWDPRKLWP